MMRTSHFLLLAAFSVACGSTTPTQNPASFGTISVTLSDALEGGSSGTGHCAVADSTGTLTVPPTLMAAFHSGDSCWGLLTRSSSVVTNVTGSVTFESKALASFSASVN